ncbi:hypothetical protein [Deinococcus sp. Leaf326]|uniref:hypothetical protein n=1 Tax=Deinococcus sp. Leaf326 TaxID=1736338 RepID=UPI0006F4591E|nr:hypothetical protein [Deinococcus sp. Leaf326]KQR37782.1 hypothetical protein ASF71_14975 [Deinococcus sp. Leaf326]
MTRLRHTLTLLMRGQLALVSTAPVTETVFLNEEERIIVDSRWNRETHEGRVITNMSRRVAAEVHSDLGRVPDPSYSTEKYAEGLGIVLYPSGGKA